MTLDPTLRDQLAKTIHDAVCPCAHFPDRRPATCNDYLAAADKAAELLTPQPAPIVLPTVEEVARLAYHLYWGELKFKEEFEDAPWPEMARAILDLIASRVRHWVPVEPGTVIKAGTRVREDWDDQITEWTLGEELDKDPKRRYWFDPRTVPAEPEDPRVELLAEELEAASGCCLDSWPCSEADRWYRDARLILARLDAVRTDA